MSKPYVYAISVRAVVALFLMSLMAACGSTPTPAPPTATSEPTVATVPTDTPEPATPETSTEPSTSGATPTLELADIITILAGADGLEEFTRVVEQVDLTEKLQSDGPFTVFVPPTRAFEELPDAVRNDVDMMQDIILYHVIPAKLTLDALIAPSVATSLLGDPLSVLLGGEGATVSGSNVLGGDFEAKNGMIHIIDTVMIPAEIEDAVMALYPSAVGEKTIAMQGNLHIEQGATSPIAYNSTPPTSGPHYANIVAWRIYNEPFRYEQVVHNLEDAGVIIYYQCDPACPELVQQLSDLVQPYIDEGRRVVLMPNDPAWTTPEGATPHQDMGAPIAVTAWRKLLTLDDFDADAISAFIEEFEGIDHHVRG